MRVPGQEPIRYGSTPGARPNAIEIEEFKAAKDQQSRASRENGATIGGTDASDDGENEEEEDGDGVDE